jgi:hypothetical protein
MDLLLDDGDGENIETMIFHADADQPQEDEDKTMIFGTDSPAAKDKPSGTPK